MRKPFFIVSILLTMMLPQVSFAATFNDPAFTTDPKDIDKQWALPAAHFLEAFDYITVSKNIVIAVVDTGIDQSHADLLGVNFVTGFDALKQLELPPGSKSDDNGHGTVITGIIAAVPNNGIGLVGAGYGASIMPIKALSADGTGESSIVAKGVKWAVDHGAKIINLSFGSTGEGRSQQLAESIGYARDKGVLVVAASGNDTQTQGKDLDTDPVFPVCDDKGENAVLGVTALDEKNIKPDFANFGKACIDVAAPGKRILSTINFDPGNGKAAPDSYVYASGTSMAAPYVTSLAALIWSKYPNISLADVVSRIVITTDKVDETNVNTCEAKSCVGKLGSGTINALKAINFQAQSLPDDGALVRTSNQGPIYLIFGSKKQQVSPFVLNQRFQKNLIQTVAPTTLANFVDSGFVPPLDGTLVKEPNNSTVYYISHGLRFPVTGEVFKHRGFKYSDVNTLTYTEINSWIKGSLLTPNEGAVVKGKRSRQVYLVLKGELHPVSLEFYNRRGLSSQGLAVFPDTQITAFPKGESY